VAILLTGTGVLAGCGGGSSATGTVDTRTTGSPGSAAAEAPLVLVTFSGESDKGGSDPINSVAGVTAAGQLITGLATGGPKLTEPRGMSLDGEGRLYLANAKKDRSQIIRYLPASSPGRFQDGSVFADPGTTAGISHPYASAFAGNGDLLISSQDTFVVSRVTPAGSAATTSPALLSTASTGKSFFPGTWAPAAERTKVSTSPQPVPPSAGGLKAPRSVAVLANRMFVADSGDASVKTYDLTTGEFLGPALANADGRPTGLVLGRRAGIPTSTVLYVGLQDSNQIVTVDVAECSANCPSSVFAEDGTGGVPLQAPSGLAVVQDQGGTALLAASRKGFAINRYSLDSDGASSAGVLIKDLPDTPEQLLAVNQGARP
jgi:hypothetical protein